MSMRTAAPSRPPRVLLQRGAVFGGVLLALVGTVVFARGVPGLAAIAASPLTAEATPRVLMGLLILGFGVALATTTRYGTPGVIAGFGVPILALGLCALVTSLAAPSETLEMASVATASDGSATSEGDSSPLLLASGLVASAVGLMLLLVFGVRARGGPSRR